MMNDVKEINFRVFNQRCLLCGVYKYVRATMAVHRLGITIPAQCNWNPHIGVIIGLGLIIYIEFVVPQSIEMMRCERIFDLLIYVDHCDEKKGLRD